MKKHIILVLSIAVMATLVLSSCKKDNDTVTFRATIADFDNPGKDSKTHIQTITSGDETEYWVNWNSGDKVMINGNGTHTVAVNSSSVATISGVASSESGYYAFYPAERAKSAGNGTAAWPSEILLPQVQIYKVENGHQVVEAPMAAYCASSSSPSLVFKNLCALLKVELPSSFDITNNEVAYITVSSSNQPLWGKATITGTTNPELNGLTLNDLSTSDKTVTLDLTSNGLNGGDGNANTSGENNGYATGQHSRGPFYIVLPPATSVSSLTVHIYVFNSSTTNNRHTVLLYEKTASSSVSILENSIYTTGTLTLSNNPPADAPYPNLGIGEFSVGSNKKVRFSLGNLQYQASTGTWRFAENQWISYKNGEGNQTAANKRSTQAKWIDLFGWGTSGYNGCNPWSTNAYATAKATSNEEGDFSNSDYDWGVNAISNGGNQPRKWRTLKATEWYYLMNTRNNHANLSKKGKLEGVSGYFIMPDNGPNVSTYQNSNEKIEIAANSDTWTQMSNAGCIFLPLTGLRNSTSVSGYQTEGYYWASSSSSRGNCFKYANSSTFVIVNFARGCGVRLVRDVN